MAPPSPPPLDTADDGASREAMLYSIRSLASYSDTLADFLDQWNSILFDVSSIAATFAADIGTDPKPASEPSPAPEPEREVAPEPGCNPAPEPDREVALEPSSKPSATTDRELKDGDPSAAAAAELSLMCEKMSSRDLRRFVTARLQDREWLRVVGPDALHRAPDPATLVLRAIGRYYIRAESREAEAACLLLLELYVRAGCPRRPGPGQGQRDAQLRQEARETALSWRSRIVRVSGRLGAAGAREARGLTLFMAAFGVPVELPPQDLYDLLAAGDSLSCTKVLRCSKIFVKMMRDAVVEMLNEDMYLQAIRVILAFKFQNAFPLAPTFTHIMEKVEHRRKKEGQEPPSKERDKEELALLRLISKCIEDHKLGPSEFSSFGIAERITLLQERVRRPKQGSTRKKRKRTTDEDN